MHLAMTYQTMFQKFIKIFQEVSELEFEKIGSPDLSAKKAKELDDALESLNCTFIWYQTQLHTDYSSRPEMKLIIGSIQVKITQLKTTLKKIIDTDATVNSNSDQIESSVPIMMNLCTQKQKFLITLIESLEKNSDVCATESQIRYDHLGFLYNSFISDQIETINNSSDTVLDSRLKLSEHIQQKVITLQTKLKIIVDSVPSNSNSKSHTEESSKPNPNEPSKQLKQSDLSANSSSKPSEDIIEKMSKLHLTKPIGPIDIHGMNQLQKLFDKKSKGIQYQIPATKPTEKSDQNKLDTLPNAISKQPNVDHKILASKTTESVNQTKPETLSDAFSTQSNINHQIPTSKPIEAGNKTDPKPPSDTFTKPPQNIDQQKQSIQTKQSDSCEHSCPWPYYKQQNELLAKINELKSMDFLSCTKSQLRTYEEQVSELRESFISNFNEIKKRVDGYFFSCLLQIVQYNFAELSNIRSKIETRSKNKSGAKPVDLNDCKIASKPGTTFTLPSTSSSQSNIADRCTQTGNPDISDDFNLATYLEKQAKIVDEMGKFKFGHYDPSAEDIIYENYREQVTVLKKSFLDNQNEIFRRIRDGYFYQFQKTLSNDVENEFKELLEDIDRISRAIII